MRDITDTGVSVSLVRQKEYRRLRNQGWMRKPDIEITQANVNPMGIKRVVNIPVSIGRR